MNEQTRRRALHWIERALLEANRVHTPEQIAEAEALLARVPSDVQPELELKAA